MKVCVATGTASHYEPILDALKEMGLEEVIHEHEADCCVLIPNASEDEKVTMAFYAGKGIPLISYAAPWSSDLEDIAWRTCETIDEVKEALADLSRYH